MALDKSILITGCSSGIGLRCAQLAKQDGYTVFASARKPQDLQMLKDQGFEHVLELDVCNQDHVDAALNYIKENNNGKLGTLFNNAGHSQTGIAEDLSIDAYREQFETNFFAVCELTRKVLPMMHEADNGRIVMNSSVFGISTSPFRSAYCASKYAMEAYSDCMRIELNMLNSNIKVCLIEPGPVVSKVRENKKYWFDKYVDKNNSRYKSFYENIESGLAMSGRIPFTVEPDVVYQRLKHIMESNKPRPRYYVTTLTYIVGYMKKILPTQIMDLFIAKVIAKKEIGK